MGVERFEFDFSSVKSFECPCGRHYINTAASHKSGNGEITEYCQKEYEDALKEDAVSKEFLAECKRAADKYRKKNDGWIPVEERLPERTLDEKINNAYKKYLVFIDSVDGWDIDIALYDYWNDNKWREAYDGYGEIENVIAWRPLPEPYRPERSKE